MVPCDESGDMGEISRRVDFDEAPAEVVAKDGCHVQESLAEGWGRAWALVEFGACWFAILKEACRVVGCGWLGDPHVRENVP